MDDFGDNAPANAYAQLSRAHAKAGYFGAAETAASLGRGKHPENLVLAIEHPGTAMAREEVPLRGLKMSALGLVRNLSRAAVGVPALANTTSVVVPVYNAADDLAVCIKRLAAYTPDSVDILFIDDVSPDLRVAQVLAEAVKQGNMRVLRNDKNVGFAATVNRGLSETGGNDVIILNSDARVTPGWFEGLLAAASSGRRLQLLLRCPIAPAPFPHRTSVTTTTFRPESMKSRMRGPFDGAV